GELVLTHDCIIRVRLETDPTSPNFNSVVVDRFKDDGTAPGSVAGDGLPDTTTPFQTVALSTGGVSNVQPIWEGGRRLALLSPGATCESSNTWPKVGNLTESGRNCRRIVTWADLSNGGGTGGGAGTETLEFSAANAATLCPYLGGANVLSCTSSGAAGTTAISEATNIINWVRGSSVSGLRDRTFNVVNDSGAIVQAQWKLGDVADAPPLGAEIWAFIPQDLLPQLRWLTLANYDHAYYVDLTPKVTDARIFTADADHPGGWGTVLIGGFRLGGSCTNCTSGKGTPRV